MILVTELTWNDQLQCIVFYGPGGFVYRFVFFKSWAYDFCPN